MNRRHTGGQLGFHRNREEPALCHGLTTEPLLHSLLALGVGGFDLRSSTCSLELVGRGRTLEMGVAKGRLIEKGRTARPMTGRLVEVEGGVKISNLRDVEPKGAFTATVALDGTWSLPDSLEVHRELCCNLLTTGWTAGDTLAVLEYEIPGEIEGGRDVKEPVNDTLDTPVSGLPRNVGTVGDKRSLCITLADAADGAKGLRTAGALLKGIGKVAYGIRGGRGSGIYGLTTGVAIENVSCAVFLVGPPLLSFCRSSK